MAFVMHFVSQINLSFLLFNHIFEVDRSLTRILHL